MSRPKPINLALQGGGAHGALAWGIIDHLLQDGRIKFDSISATSAGAMNAAVLAYGLAVGDNEHARETLYKFWKTISEAGELYNPLKKTPLEEFLNIKTEHSLSFIFVDMLTRAVSPYQLNPFNFNPLRSILEASVDFEAIHSCKSLRLFVSATNVKTGRIKVFSNKEITIDTIMASACLPFVFQAVQVGEDYFWDGGYVGNPAIFPLIYHSSCNDILVIHINPIYREALPTSATEILNRINEISFNSSLLREMRAIAFVSKLLDKGWIKDEFKKNLKRLFIHGIRADKSMASYSVASKLNPEWPFIMYLFKEGQSQAATWIKNNFRSVGKKSTVNMDEFL